MVFLLAVSGIPPTNYVIVNCDPSPNKKKKYLIVMTHKPIKF